MSGESARENDPTVDAQADEFQVAVREIDGYAVVGIAGELDIGSAPALREHLLDLGRLDRPVVALDMGQLSFIDSTGISLLITSHQRFRSQGGELRLVGVQPAVARIFQIMQLDTIFAMYPDTEAALSAQQDDPVPPGNDPGGATNL